MPTIVDDYAAFKEVYRSREEVQSMLITAIQKEKEEAFQEGRDEGRQRERVEIVHAMHRLKFELAVIASVTGLSEEQVQAIIDRDDTEQKPPEHDDDAPTQSVD